MSSSRDDKDQIREVLSRYCFHMDRGENDRWASLFSDDGMLDGGEFGIHRGRAALRKLAAGMSGSPIWRHHMTNQLLVLNGNCATAASYVLVLDVSQNPPSIMFSGCYRDELVKLGDQWRIKSRTVLQCPIDPDAL